MGSNCPSQRAQPAGAKLPPNIRISPTYGLLMGSSVLGREDALEGDDEVDAQVRLHVLVRLAPAGGSDHVGIHPHEVVRRGVEGLAARSGEAARFGGGGGGRGGGLP